MLKLTVLLEEAFEEGAHLWLVNAVKVVGWQTAFRFKLDVGVCSNPCPGPTVHWALREKGGQQPSTTPFMQQRAFRWLCGGPLGIELASHLDTCRGLMSLSWVVWRRAYDIEEPRTPDDSRNITEDVKISK